VAAMDAGRDRWASLAGRPGLSPDILELESALLDWRTSVGERLEGGYPLASADPSPLSGLTGDARPEELPQDSRTPRDPEGASRCLAARIDPLPPADVLFAAASDLLALIESRLPSCAPLARWWNPQTGRDARDRFAADWFTAAWRRDGAAMEGLSKAVGLDADLLAWCGRELCRPFFHRLGRLPSAAASDPSLANAACPVCGGPPRMARLEREEGHRFLWCDLCDVQWAFRRVTCPFCGNADQKELGYLAIEGLDSHRIDVCEKCRGYLRTVAERGMPEGQRIDYLAEDAGTPHLCLVAEGKGYRPGGWERGSPAPAASERAGGAAAGGA